MCTIKNYLDALDKEIQLRLNGYQTTLLEAKFEKRIMPAISIACTNRSGQGPNLKTS